MRRLITFGTALAAAVPFLIGTAHGVTTAHPRGPGGSTLSATDRLQDRRFVAAGTRAYEVGTETGRYDAAGWHTRGEMGGIWSPPVKLLDGVWFGVDGSWVGPATRFTSGWGYVGMDLPGAAGAHLTRTDFVPDGHRAVLIGLTVSAGAAPARFDLAVDAHSELTTAYPWGWTTPDQTTANLPDTASVQDGRLVFRDQGGAAGSGSAHDWAALVGPAAGTDLRATGAATGADYRGPQDPAVICPVASSPDPAPPRCDDTGYGRGAGGELRYRVDVGARQTKHLWFVVAGSDQGLPQAAREFRSAAADPGAELAAKVGERRALAANTRLDLPGDPQLAQAIDWDKQNLADLRQQADDVRVRVTNGGTAYPAPSGTVPRISFVGAGYPDYPWMFATDGEYTAFADVGVGQFTAVEDHLRSLMAVSEVANKGSGKVVHETVTTGDVYYGADDDAGNTDETVKFPSAVSLVWRWTGDDAFLHQMYDFTRRNLHYVVDHLAVDADGWPGGGGNVENPGQGEAKLDSAVYLVRGLLDEVQLARHMDDTATARWAKQQADRLSGAFEKDWWDSPEASGYADSLAEPGGAKLYQRYWTGLTPMEAELWSGDRSVPGLADPTHALPALDLRETACYTGPTGLYEDGQGATTAVLAPPQPTFSCGDDHAVSTAPDDKDSYTVNTGVMAVAEGNYGRLAQQLPYLDDLAALQVPTARGPFDEMPGALPEIAPSLPHPPYYGVSLDRQFTERAQVMQAWGSYGTVWPVVHQQLGVSPDLGDARLSVVPQVPPYEDHLSGRGIRLGAGAADVVASAGGGRYQTTVDLRNVTADLTIGATLPTGAQVGSVTLDGAAVPYTSVVTNRGREVLVDAGHRTAAHLVVTAG